MIAWQLFSLIGADTNSIHLVLGFENSSRYYGKQEKVFQVSVTYFYSVYIKSRAK